MDKTKVMEALEQWILDVTENRESATTEEVEVLPEVARAFLEHCETESIPLFSCGFQEVTLEKDT